MLRDMTSVVIYVANNSFSPPAALLFLIWEP